LLLSFVIILSLIMVYSYNKSGDYAYDEVVKILEDKKRNAVVGAVFSNLN